MREVPRVAERRRQVAELSRSTYYVRLPSMLCDLQSQVLVAGTSLGRARRIHLNHRCIVYVALQGRVPLLPAMLNFNIIRKNDSCP